MRSASRLFNNNLLNTTKIKPGILNLGSDLIEPKDEESKLDYQI